MGDYREEFRKAAREKLAVALGRVRLPALRVVETSSECIETPEDEALFLGMVDETVSRHGPEAIELVPIADGRYGGSDVPSRVAIALMADRSDADDVESVAGFCCGYGMGWRAARAYFEACGRLLPEAPKQDEQPVEVMADQAEG